MAFILIIFGDMQRKTVIEILRFKRMKDIIAITNNRVNYYDVRRNHDTIKYKTKKSLFQVIKV